MVISYLKHREMNILVTNFENTGEDVMIFTQSFTPAEVAKRLHKTSTSFEEVYEVEDKEIQFYIFEPCWIEKKMEVAQ